MSTPAVRWRYQCQVTFAPGGPRVVRYEVYTASGPYGNPATCEREEDARRIVSDHNALLDPADPAAQLEGGVVRAALDAAGCLCNALAELSSEIAEAAETDTKWESVHQRFLFAHEALKACGR